jgi:gliding motility-associated-like protein
VPPLHENQPLFTNIPNQTISAAQSFTAFDLDNYLIELDNDTVLYSVQNLNHLIITMDGNNVVSINPIVSSWTGSDTVRFVVTDSTLNQLSGYQDVVYTIIPVVDTIVLAGIPNQTIYSNQTFTKTNLLNYLTYLYPDSVVWTVSSSQLVTSVQSDTLVALFPIANWTGIDTIIVRATQLNHPTNYDVDTMIYISNPLPDTIVLAGIPNQTIYSNQTFTKTNLLSYLSYLYPDSVVWTVSSSQLVTSVQSDTLVALFPIANWTGIDTIIVRATQLNHPTNYDVDTMIYISNPLPDTIVLAGIPNQTISNNQLFAKTNLLSYLSYLYPDSVVWSVSSNQLVTSVQSDTLVALFPIANWVGVDTIIVRATQLNHPSNYDVDTIIYISNALPDTIVLAGIPNQTISNNQLFAKTNLLSYLSYLYPDSVIWSVSSSQLISSVQNDTLKITLPNSTWIGTDTIIVKAEQLNHPTNYDVDTVIYTRTELNTKPTITIKEYTVFEDALLQTDIGQIDFVDANTTQSHTFSLITTNLPFILDSLTGKMFVNAALDYEVKSSYPAKVVIRDNGILMLTDTATITIRVLDIAEGDKLPSGDFVSPNADGKNDVWLIDNVIQFQKFSLSILDANGQSVYTIADNYNNDWDAKLNGVPLPNGNYYYIFREPETNKTFKGVITVSN